MNGTAWTWEQLSTTAVNTTPARHRNQSMTCQQSTPWPNNPQRRMTKKEHSDDVVTLPEGKQLQLPSIVLWNNNHTQTLSYAMAITYSSAKRRWGCNAMQISVCFACVWGVVSTNCIFSLHQLLIRVVLKDREEVKEERLQYWASSVTPRGAGCVTVISNTLINEHLYMLMVVLLTSPSSLSSRITPNWRAKMYRLYIFMLFILSQIHHIGLIRFGFKCSHNLLRETLPPFHRQTHENNNAGKIQFYYSKNHRIRHIKNNTLISVVNNPNKKEMNQLKASTEFFLLSLTAIHCGSSLLKLKHCG